MPPAATAFLKSLRDGAERCRKQAQDSTDNIHGSVWNSWADCYEHIAREAGVRLLDVEAEARLIPEIEETFDSLRERLISEEFAA